MTINSRTITQVVAWQDSSKLNEFMDFSSITRFTADTTLNIPTPILQQVYNHLEIESYQDTLIITGFTSTDKGVYDDEQAEEIWDMSKYVHLPHILSDNMTIDGFSWGKATIGYILINLDDTEVIQIPAYWTQNACPIGIVISDKYRNLLKGN